MAGVAQMVQTVPVPVVLRGTRQAWLGGCRHFSAWQAPSCDCYALLGVQPSASAADIKAAYLLKAKAAHPDTAGSDADGSKMAQLNLCYEALTRKRSEYDSAKGVGGPSSRGAAYSANREAWWKAKDSAEDFADFGMEWEEMFYGRARGAGARSSSSTQRPFNGRTGEGHWKEWADAWRAEHQASWEQRRRPPRRRGRQSAWRMDLSDSEEDSDEGAFHYGRRSRTSFWSDSDDDADDFARASSSSSRRPRGRRQSRPWQGGETPPAELWIQAPPGSRSGGERWDRLSGQFTLLEENVNGRSAYAKAGNRSLYMFWSKKFGDWKLAERLEDDGSCVAFAEDKRGRRPPWAPFAPRWKLWDPAAKRFVLRRLSVVGCDEAPVSDPTAARAARTRTSLGRGRLGPAGLRLT
eukprot:SRR837773.16658.p1 GENE.SRR837773.16658~~SRR837773.16658.p1  ORF type:complete len:420 (-),score=110.88 SRR837773.16658:116-1342(-)